jgi:hypothetical protein
MAPDELKPEGGRSFLTDLAPWADTLSKSVAAIAIALYVCGFLIFSLHHANYGFVVTSPFRPRILAAGAWFVFFTAIPVAIATRYRERPWVSVVGGLAFALFIFYGMSNVLFFLLFDLEQHPPSVGPYRWTYWVWMVAILVAATAYVYASRSKKTTANLLAVASGAFVLFTLGMWPEQAISHTQAESVMEIFRQQRLRFRPTASSISALKLLLSIREVPRERFRFEGARPGINIS